MMRTLAALVILSGAGSIAWAQAPVPPASATPLVGATYDADFFPGNDHDPAVPTPDSILGFRLGDKPTLHAQIRSVMNAIAGSSPRARLVEYATSHEGRTLFYLVIGSEANIRRLDEIKSNAARLADPRTIAAAEADRLVGSTPAIAWMAYVIHGDEMSGSDASLALAYHLAAGRDPAVQDLLDKVLVIIDPDMNPDGRDRCITDVQRNRTVQPSVDDQSLIHAQSWPTGRMNHYLFDMNRDWIFCTQPETRGRVKAVNEWNPHYFMESHEMGPLDTFLVMPPRAPVNPNIPEHVRRWERAFADDLGKAFDARGWRYYTGEWNEGWYPGYSGSWAAMRGIVDNLYEQATIVSDAIRRPEGTLETYRESVHKQLVASMANLESLARNKAEVMSGVTATRRKAVEGDGEAQRLFVIKPSTANDGRLTRLADLIELQGIEAMRSNEAFTASGRDWLGREFQDVTFPAGTWVIPSRQPLGGLASALFEMDPRMESSFLTEERRELLRFGRSRLYDITGWNVAMLFGIEVCEINAVLPSGLTRLGSAQSAPAPEVALSPDAVAHLLDGRDDRCMAAAARLMARGLRVRVLNKPSVLDGADVARGSVFITKKDNQGFAGDQMQVIREVCGEFGLRPRAVKSGMGPGDAPDMGGEHFVLLESPRVAVLTREPFNPYTVGEVWHLLDHEMGMRAAFINTPQLGGVDLRRYNVLIVPDGGTDGWSESIPTIRSWVEAGGTLIGIGSAASAFCKEKDGIGSTRLLPDVLTKLDDYRAAIVRDWLGKNIEVKPEEVWSHAAPNKLEYPWTLGDSDKPSEEEAKRRDAWRSLFMPQGAIVAARVDDRHWLTAGCGEVLPVLVGSGPVLIPKFGGNAPLLLGVFTPAPAPAAEEPERKSKPEGEKPDKDEKSDKPEKPSPGWLVAPPGSELRLRMSGLLWPEAADRLAHSAYVTQESVGAGQIILFNESPTFRAAARGSTRVFMNAVVCGPGMGASAPITP
ncbi:MAG: peptidase [Phycisphaerae bacterium]|nr:peptidase [Phycisphaerae bacterium]